MYILSLMGFTEYWFFSFTVTVCNTSTPHQSEVLFLRCACRKLLWLLLKLLRCIVYFCISAESVCLCVLLLCRWVKQETELSKNAQLGDSGPKLDLGFKEGQTITLNIGVRTSLCAYTIHAEKKSVYKRGTCRAVLLKDGVEADHANESERQNDMMSHENDWTTDDNRIEFDSDAKDRITAWTPRTAGRQMNTDISY